MNSIPAATEADLESNIHLVMIKAFPWLSPSDLHHQTTFSIRIGRTQIDVGGTNVLQGRSDILVSVRGKPLAVLELKKPGTPITKEDVAQGMSYARLTEPLTPLVIIANGNQVAIYTSFSGEEWVPQTMTEIILSNRLLNIGKLAEARVSDAISVLMDSGVQHWINALREVSRAAIEIRTGGWGKPCSPFVIDFLIKRKVADEIVEEIQNGLKAIVVHGPPLSGKSSIIRQIASILVLQPSIALLIVEPSEHGLFESISQILSSELSWTVTREEAIEWLRRVSFAQDATLIIIVDGIAPDSRKVITDLNELSSDRFGGALRLVVTTDDTLLDFVIKKSNGREANALGRIARTIEVLSLDDDEFKNALDALSSHKVALFRGGEQVAALREPWVLRLLVPWEGLSSLPENAELRIPPVLDLQSFQNAPYGVPMDAKTAISMRLVADTVLRKYLTKRAHAEMLQGIDAFVVDSRFMENGISERALHELEIKGFLKQSLDWNQRPIWIVRVPLFVATLIASLVAEKIRKLEDPNQIAAHLVKISSLLPFGELIAADALIKSRSRLTFPIVNALVGRPAKSEKLSPGARFVFSLQGEMLEATVIGAGVIEAETRLGTFRLDLSEDGDLPNVTEFGGALILSHLAIYQMVVEDNGDRFGLEDSLLLLIGQTPTVLCRPNSDLSMIKVHDIPGIGSIVCHWSGVVEPVTWALVQYFLRRSKNADAWLIEAVEKNSLPLLARISIALGQVSKIVDSRGPWAKKALAELITPAFDRFSKHH